MSGVGSLMTSGPLILAIPVAAAAGAITFLSPCCLPLVPGYLSYVTGMSGSAVEATGSATGSEPGEQSGPADSSGGVATVTIAPARTQNRSRVMLGTLLFVLGFSALFAVEG